MTNIHSAIKNFREVLRGVWYELLPTMALKPLRYPEIYKDLILLEKLLKAVTEELKKRALVRPMHYPVKIIERKTYGYKEEEKILKELLTKYPVEKITKLKGYSALSKEIDGKDLIHYIIQGLIQENITKVVKLES